MRTFTLAFAGLLVLSGAAFAADTSCTAQSKDKKLAGAAMKSFMTKCESEAKAACAVNATSQKLAGAAKTSYEKKCAADAISGKK